MTTNLDDIDKELDKIKKVIKERKKEEDKFVVKQQDCPPPQKLAWVGRVFQWIDVNILSNTTRLWMYILEILGIVAICIIMFQFNSGLQMISSAKTDFEIAKAKLFIESVKESATPIATMVATICGALPTVMGIFRSLKKKWTNGESIPTPENKTISEDEIHAV